MLGAVLAASPGAFASHGTAARLWGWPEQETSIEIVVARESHLALPGVRVHRSLVWDERDVGEIRLVPVTSAARTLVDISKRVDDGVLDQLVDDGMRRGILSLNALTRCAAQFGIAHGRSPARLARVLADRTPGLHAGDSALEARVLRVIRDAGLPEPVVQHEVCVDGKVYRADLAYPKQRVVIEVDGFDFHRPRTAFDADRQRQNAFVLLGLTVLRFTSRSTDHDIARTVARALFGDEHPLEGP